MSNYNDNWKAFVNETKEMSDEQLQEYISDIRSAVGGLFNQSGQGDQYSGLKGLRPEPKPQTGSDSEDSIVYGINSEDNSESLYSLLDALVEKGLLSEEQRDKLVELMLQQTAKDEIVLEAIGDPQRDNRTFSSDTVTKLNALINSFNLQDNAKSQLEKVLNRWAKLNTVKFGSPTAATASPEEPKKDSVDVSKLLNAESLDAYVEEYNRLVDADARKGKIRKIDDKVIQYVRDTDGEFEEDDLVKFLRVRGRLSSFDNPETLKKFIQLARAPNPPKEETSGEEEPQATKEEVKKQFEKLPKEKQEEIKQDIKDIKAIETLTQDDDPNKEGWLSMMQNPFLFLGAWGFNGFKALKTLIKLEKEDQLTAKSLLEVGGQFIFDNTDAILFGVLPDNSLYLIKNGRFSELASATGANISSAGLGVLEQAEKGCNKSKKIAKNAGLISKIPEFGPIIVGIAAALYAILCPIASLKGILEPLFKDGSLQGLENDPYYQAGALGLQLGFTDDRRDGKYGVTDSPLESPTKDFEDDIGEFIEELEGGIKQGLVTNPDETRRYIYGLKTFKTLVDGFVEQEADNRGKLEGLPDMSEPEEGEEAEETEPASSPEALSESKQLLRWKLIAGIK